MTGTAKYTSDDIEITFQCDMERNDYGVPGSPVWLSPVPGTEEIVELSIAGVEVDPKSLPLTLLNALYALSDGLDYE
jgi:hypothetical protein